MSDASKPVEKTFGDSWYSLILMVGIIVLGRIYLLEPFKIPSGSMESTLVGHPDFGDRILTNKLAYVMTSQALLAAGAFLVLILQGLAWSVEYARYNELRSKPSFFATTFLVAIVVAKSFRLEFYPSWFDFVALGVFALLAVQTVYWYIRNISDLKLNPGAVKWSAFFVVAILGGMGYAWTQNAIAAEPRRFDVPVFEYNSDWGDGGGKSQDINYIKRLTGLPGERIMISGGDLFLYDKKAEKYNIIRKWKERGNEVQDVLWFPVSKAFEPRFTDPELADAAEEALVKRQLRDLVFPWNGVDEKAIGATLAAKEVQLDGTSPVDLKYKFPVSNIYLKQGLWPFTHMNCPSAHMPPIKSESGISWRNPNSKPEEIEAVVSNTWEGVQCPNCRHIFFPLQLGEYSDTTVLRGRQDSGRFQYGGKYPVGDLKIDLKLTVESAGTLHIESGNSVRRAIWNIPGGGETDSNDSPEKGGKKHFVQKQTSALSPGEHTLSLAYVDGTVIAILDGVEIERRLIDIEPLSNRVHRDAESIARVVLTGMKGRITQLNLSRDLYYTSYSQSSADFSPDRGSSGHLSSRGQKHAAYNDDDNLVINVQEGEYLMMGDNSPGSSDGRFWGFVPRERLMGRALLVGWPLSRWKWIK
ncbi:MAG: S26 family signal peptidase [Planctomycetota bacterium]